MRGRKALISAQVSLTLALVMVASLFVETLRHLREEPLGFGVEGVLNTQLIPLPGGYANGFRPAIYYRALLQRMQSLPGVQAASLSHFSPLFTVVISERIRAAEPSDAVALRAPIQWVSDGFLATKRIPLLRGRDFRRSDTPDSPKTAIVSASLAKRLFPAGDGDGEHLSVGSRHDAEDVEIVGVAADARLQDPRAKDLSFLYLDYWQFPRYEGWGDLQLRCFGDPAPLIPMVRKELREAGHEYALHLRTLVDQRDISLMQEKLLALLGTAFGALALTLAGVGLFGLLSLLVASRTKEIGVRVALGATPRDVSWLVIREVFALVAAGFLLGLPISYASARAISALLYGVEAVPIFPVALSMAVLLAVAGAATVIPVRRATKVDPMVALRYE
jgi:predicted permease